MSAKHQPKSLNAVIASVAQDLANSTSVPKNVSILLQLKEKLKDSSTLKPQTVAQSFINMWRSDIIHVLIEVLREDFSSLQGQWSTAADLSSLLGRICSSIQPKVAGVDHGKPPDTFSKEEIEEYYDILLPTATDSFLILANNIHEVEPQEDDPPDVSTKLSPTKVHLDQFKLVLLSLCRMCTVHTLCISRVIQSPYLLHLLVSDDQDCSYVVLNVLHELVSQDKLVLPTEALHSLLDELVFKIGGTNEQLAMTSLSLLGLFSTSNGAVFDLICERYKGLSILLEKWSGLFDGSVKHFAETLLERVKISDEEYRQCKAAIIIQAGWRGYCSRRKMLKVKRGITRFQRLYRLKRAGKIRKEIVNSLNQSTKRLELIQKIQSARECHEKQKAMLEQLPASLVDGFLSRQDRDAATKIQSWWRGLRDRKKAEEIRLNKLRDKSAVVIQRAYRRKRIEELNQSRCVLSGPSSPPTWDLPPLTVAEREYLESDIALDPLVRTPHPPTATNELSNALEWFYSSRGEAREADRRRAFLLAQLSRQCDQLLMNMPSLSNSTEDTYKIFMSRSGAVATMAERAHREELTSMELPWWKRAVTSREELEL